MTQYRVKLSVTQEMLVDVTAETPEEAGSFAKVPFAGDRVFITVLDVHEIAGQEYVPVNEPQVEGAA